MVQVALHPPGDMDWWSPGPSSGELGPSHPWQRKHGPPVIVRLLQTSVSFSLAVLVSLWVVATTFAFVNLFNLSGFTKKSSLRRGKHSSNVQSDFVLTLIAAFVFPSNQ